MSLLQFTNTFISGNDKKLILMILTLQKVEGASSSLRSPHNVETLTALTLLAGQEIHIKCIDTQS